MVCIPMGNEVPVLHMAGGLQINELQVGHPSGFPPWTGGVETGHVALVRSVHSLVPCASRRFRSVDFWLGVESFRNDFFWHYVGDTPVDGLRKILLRAWLVVIDEGWLTLFMALSKD